MIELESPQIESVETEGSFFARYEASPLPAGLRRDPRERPEARSPLVAGGVGCHGHPDPRRLPRVQHDPRGQGGRHPDRPQPEEAPHEELRPGPPGPAAPREGGCRGGPRCGHRGSAEVEIINPDLHVCTLDSDDVSLEMDLTVESGIGYLGADRTEPLPIGVIPVDAIFSPVRRVNYSVENTRVGQMTNYDKLTLEIETDGTITPGEALSRAAEILIGQFGLFTRTGRAAPAGERAGAPGRRSPRTCWRCRSRSWTSRCGPTTPSSGTTSSRSDSSCSSATTTSCGCATSGRSRSTR